MRRSGSATCALVLGVAVVFTALAGVPSATAVKAANGPLDCTNWRYGAADEPASLPAEFDRNNYKRTSLRDPSLSSSPQNLCGQKGAAVDLAWGLSEGSPSVLDRGARLGHRVARTRPPWPTWPTKAHLNLGEAKPPCYPTQPDGDCNGDGRFNLADFGAHRRPQRQRRHRPRGPDPRPGVQQRRRRRPQRLRRRHLRVGTSSTATTTRSTPSTTATAPVRPRTPPRPHNGTGDVGTCPECQLHPGPGRRLVHRRRRPLRRGRALRARLAAPTSSRRRSARSATRPRRSRRSTPRTGAGVLVVASMADEASKHPNLPGALEHTLAGELGDRQGQRAAR